MMSKMLLAIDKASEVGKFVDFLDRFVQTDGSRIKIIHVLDRAEKTPARCGHSNLDQAGFMQEAFERFAADFPRLQFESAILNGSPAQEIVDTAREMNADFILIGRCEKNEPDVQALGYTAEYVIGHAPCSVIVLETMQRRNRRPLYPCKLASVSGGKPAQIQTDIPCKKAQGIYMCQTCGLQFTYDGKQLFCPKCKKADTDDLVIIYLEDDKEESELHSAADWVAGD